MEIKIDETDVITSKKVIGTQVPQDIYDKLKKQAENDFMSVSDVLRKIIYLYFRNQEMKGDNK